MENCKNIFEDTFLFSEQNSYLIDACYLNPITENFACESSYNEIDSFMRSGKFVQYVKCKSLKETIHSNYLREIIETEVNLSYIGIRINKLNKLLSKQ